jgi:acylphosphatase
MEAEQLIVYGRVQGVGFRAFVARTAMNCQLSGFVENLEDGTVRIIAQGSLDSIEKLIQEIKKAPSPITVNRIEREQSQIRSGLLRFEVKLGYSD